MSNVRHQLTSLSCMHVVTSLGAFGIDLNWRDIAKDGLAATQASAEVTLQCYSYAMLMRG